MDAVPLQRWFVTRASLLSAFGWEERTLQRAQAEGFPHAYHGVYYIPEVLEFFSRHPGGAPQTSGQRSPQPRRRARVPAST